MPNKATKILLVDILSFIFFSVLTIVIHVIKGIAAYANHAVIL